MWKMFADKDVTKATIKWSAFPLGEKDLQRFLLSWARLVNKNFFKSVAFAKHSPQQRVKIP